MIYQAIFNILNIYFEENNLFYSEVSNFFMKKINDSIEINSKLQLNPNDLLNQMIDIINNFFIKLGMDEQELLDKTNDPFLQIREDKKNAFSTKKIFKKKIEPLIHEIIYEKICEYIGVDAKKHFLINLHEAGAIPLELLVEIKDLCDLIDRDPSKKDHFRHYVKTKKLIIQKFEKDKEEIESLERFKKTTDNLQLFYLIYRIIEFFNLHKTFHYQNLEEYLKNHTEKWISTLPLVSLKNPDLYYCGLYLAKHIGLEVEEEKIKDFLVGLWNEIIDEFESPIVEGTSKLYYFIKSLRLLGIEMGKDRIELLINFDAKFFEDHYLKEFETSKLVVIKKICKMLNIERLLIDSGKSQKIDDEINKRITDKGITQYRDELISSEAIYYVLFYYYMEDKLEDLRELNLVETLVLRIHRNIEIISFSEQTNNDLVSELFYSCEALKLFNCIENKKITINLAEYLFPEDVIREIEKNEDFYKNESHFLHKHIDRFTGETYLSQ